MTNLTKNKNVLKTKKSYLENSFLLGLGREMGQKEILWKSDSSWLDEIWEHLQSLNQILKKL